MRVSKGDFYNLLRERLKIYNSILIRFHSMEGTYISSITFSWTVIDMINSLSKENEVLYTIYAGNDGRVKIDFFNFKDDAA